MATSRYTAGGLREVSSNVSYDYKDRISRVPSSSQLSTDAVPLTGRRSSSTHHVSGRSPSVGSGRYSAQPHRSAVSPGVDRAHRHNPAAVSEIAQDIVSMFLQREKTMQRDPNYMSNQAEVNEKMRTILIDWLVDVHLKFKLHEETFFLTVDLIDRYLSVARVVRSQLQLVGVTCILLAAKYEEIWPPEVKECVHISANTYTRDEILKMERDVCAALSFKLTTPTPFPMLIRLLEVTEADSATRNAAFFFLEHAVLDYKHLHFLPSQLANASMYLANLMLRKPDAWSYTMEYYSQAKLASFKDCAQNLIDFTALVTNSKYQAIRRKYSSAKYGEVARNVLPEMPQ